MEKYEVSKMKFAATYKGTGELVLVFGSMTNLGDQKINRHMASDISQVDIMDNTVIRFHVYRDEIPIQWPDFVQSPVRALCQLLPVLQLCSGKGSGTNCPKSHSVIGESLDSIIMDHGSVGKILWQSVWRTCFCPRSWLLLCLHADRRECPVLLVAAQCSRCLC